MLTVPAHQFLWGYFDEAANHRRRYSEVELRKKLTAAGFEVEFQSQFMACIFPIVWIFRKISGLRQKPNSSNARTLAGEEFRLVPIANRILTLLLSLSLLAGEWPLASNRHFLRGHSSEAWLIEQIMGQERIFEVSARVMAPKKTVQHPKSKFQRNAIRIRCGFHDAGF